MIAVELLIGVLIASVLLVGITKIGVPIADAFAQRLRLKFQELEPEEEKQLKARIAFLEEELRSLKQQVGSIQETTAFTMKLLGSGQAEKLQLGQSTKEETVPETKKV